MLFGIDKESRGLFKSKEMVPSRNGNQGDPALSTLCGKEDASSIFDTIGSQIQDREAYDTTLNFPHLGKRLMKLHEFNAHFQPSAWRAIFADKRDPQRKVAFIWTVVIFGGMTFFLSLIQTVVAIVQLKISIGQ